MTRALITGITGQDGSYLAELLLQKGYEVVGIVRPHQPIDDARILAMRDRLRLVPVDLLDEAAIQVVLEQVRPIEVYNLAARASSAHLFAQPVLTVEANAVSVLCLLEAIRKVDPSIRFCQASSSEMFGAAVTAPQSEETPFRPRNPYGISKLCAHWFTVNYRQTHGLFSCSSILFNHESPRRTIDFVTRRITSGVAAILHGRRRHLTLANLEARRDWGYAPDYVHGMWLMLQTAVPDDYVFATGESHSVRELCEIAFAHAGLDYRDFVEARSTARIADEALLVGDAAKARAVLGWRPTVKFDELVKLMVDADIALGKEFLR